MTKTRRILSFIIVLAIMLSVIPCNAIIFALEDGLDIEFSDEGSNEPTEDNIPEQVGDDDPSGDLEDTGDDLKNYVATVNGVKYESFEEAFSAANAVVNEPAEIVLLADASLGKGDVLADIVLDLNGYTLTATVGNFLWIQGGSLTVKDTSASGDGMIYVPQEGNAILAFYGTFTMESGTIVSQNNVVYTGGSAEVNIKGGTLTSVIDTGNVFYLIDANAVTTISGGYINGPSLPYAGQVVVTGGSFSHSSLISYCADGYTAEEIDGRWIVRSVEKIASVFIGENGYYTLEEALNAAKAGDVIEIRVAGNYSLKNNNYTEGAYCLPAGLTIKGTVEGVTVVNGPTINASNITIENVDFINGSNVSIAFRTFGNSVFRSCSLIAPNGTYYSAASGTLLFENCVINGSTTYGLAIFEGNAAITVKGCTLAGYHYFGDTNGVLIEDCTFENATYSELVSSEDFKIVNTEFPSNYSISSYYGPLLLEIENCTVDGEKTIVDIIDIEMIDAARDVIVDGVSLKIQYAAEVNGVKYETLTEAIEAAQAGDTITLLSDFTLSKRLVATKDLTIDLNGHTWTSTATSALAVSGCYIKVTDSSDAKNGTVKAGSGTSGNAIQVINNGEFVLENGNIHSANNGIYVNNGTVTISGGTVTGVANSSAALYLQSNATVTITGGNIEAHNGIMLWENISLTISGGTITGTGSTGIQGNGTYDDTAISISGGNISGRWAAVYHPQGGELNISGKANLTGYTGVVVKGGTINISGGTINGTGAADTYKPLPSGYIDTGDGLYIEHYDNSTNEENYGTPVVTITGGTFTSVYGKAVASYANTNNSVTALDSFISGGTFTTDVSDLCADGFACVDNGDGTYSVAVAHVKVIAGTIVSLKDSISIKFYFTKSTFENGKDYFLVFSANGIESQVVKLSDCTVDSSYYMYEYKVFAKQMADDISVIAYKGTDTTDRSARYSTEFSTSIRAYAMTLLNKSDSTVALKTALVDMLNYGAAAQIQFNYNTGDLANATLTDAHKAFATTTTPSISNDAYNKGTTGYFAGTIATLADNLKLNLFFNKNLLQQRENVQFAIKYTNYRGESVSYTVNGTDAIVDGSYLKLSVPVVASDIRTKISCEIYIDGVLVDTVTHSIEAYCYSLIKSGKEIDICESIMKYGDSAKAYFKN